VEPPSEESHSAVKVPAIVWGSVTGAPGRKTDPKIATSPKTQSRRVIKIKIIQSRIKR